MPAGELPNVASRTHTDTVEQTDRSAAEGVLIDSSRSDAWAQRISAVSATEPSKPSDRSHPTLPSAVIHELRTPLTSIHGYAQVLQRNLKNDPRATNALAVVVRESTRLSGMLAALSELAELESGEESSPPMQVEAEQIVDGVIHEVLRRDGQAHPIEMTGRGTACCNPTSLNQALLHILTNAVRYSDAGAPVTVTIRETPQAVVIDVADRGIGMEQDDAERLYQPFQRGGLARQEGIRGLGLGLFLARETLRQAGGELEHLNRDGGGTTFRITLTRA